MTVHPIIAGSRLEKMLSAFIAECADDPATSIGKMIIGAEYHPDGEYDIQPIRMMRAFIAENPTHRLAKQADWSSDMVWMDEPDEVISDETPTPDFGPKKPPEELAVVEAATENVIEQEPKIIDPQPEPLPQQSEPAKLERKTKKTTQVESYDWDDDGRIVKRTIETETEL